MYGVGVDTSRARSAPVIGGLASTRLSSPAGSGLAVLMAARMAPCSRSSRVSARVPVIAMPGMPWAASSACRLRCARQLEVILAGSLTT